MTNEILCVDFGMMKEYHYETHLNKKNKYTENNTYAYRLQY